MSQISTCLWFQKDGLQAAELYISLIPNSKILNIQKLDPEGTMIIISLELDGVPYTFFSMQGYAELTDAASIMYTTSDQEETDRIWNALTSDGGVEMPCGWLRDRFGLAWQIAPKQLLNAMSSSDREAAGRAQAAMMTMKKIDIAAIEAAFKGE